MGLGISAAIPFAELSATSSFTFLTGASHPEEYTERAAVRAPWQVALRLGLRQIKGITQDEADWITAVRGNATPVPRMSGGAQG